jgi:hypothetical protein
MKLRLWVDIAEITASVAVVVTLLLLILQIRESDESERVQNVARMAQWDAQLYVMSDRLPQIASKIEAVNNPDYLMEFRERYDLSVEEAGIWNRWLLLLWKSAETEFLSTGPSERLARLIPLMAAYEDQRLVIVPLVTSRNPLFHDEFTEYVASLVDDPPANQPE